MASFLALTALYIAVVVGVGGILAWARLSRSRVTQWLPNGCELISAASRLKSVNWNGDEGKGSGGK
jgi:hypothetical protein